MAGIYDWYIDKLNTQISPSLVTAFSDTINNGFTNPNKRLSYKQWLRALDALMQPPTIKSFSADQSIIIGGIPVNLKWQVEKAHTIIIDNGIGNVTGKTEIKVRPDKNTTYNLKAIGHFGEIEKSVDITIFPTPVIETLFIPTVNFNSGVSVNPISISSPYIHNKVEFENSLQISTPKFTDLNQNIVSAKPLFKKESVSISSIFEKIKNNILNNI